MNPQQRAIKYDRHRGVGGFIYVAHAPEVFRIKVGWTRRPAKRVSSIHQASPTRVELVASWPGQVDDEERLHELLIEFHNRNEWHFDCTAFREALSRVAPVEILWSSRSQLVIEAPNPLQFGTL